MIFYEEIVAISRKEKLNLVGESLTDFENIVNKLKADIYLEASRLANTGKVSLHVTHNEYPSLFTLFIKYIDFNNNMIIDLLLKELNNYLNDNESEGFIIHVRVLTNSDAKVPTDLVIDVIW